MLNDSGIPPTLINNLPPKATPTKNAHINIIIQPVETASKNMNTISKVKANNKHFWRPTQSPVKREE